ncbi:MAG: serpin family protein, partial [Polyangiaceae bacterium]
PTMSGKVNLAMGSGSTGTQTFSAYELPYKGRALAIDFLVPSGPLPAFEASLTADALAPALASLGRPGNLTLFLPKFSIRTRLDLAAVLGGMGMPDVFDPSKADLSGMDGKRDLYVFKVVHEARVEVDEQGSVATAATAVVVNHATCTCGGGVPLTVRIDQPFLFLIRDVGSRSILFMGRVVDPRQT